MFGDLFEEDEDFSFLSNNSTTNGRKTKSKDSEILEPRGETRLSGLRNQGSTCYLNSLLQTLLFTPEFREALFGLSPAELGSLEEKDVPNSKVRIIPLQLQRLFAELLLVDQQAASTSELTSSFGWDNNEETGQHDVQELNRILFSALESSLEGTSGHDLIKNLYHGTIVNRIQCQKCGHVSERQEDFLDLTVAVKDMSSIEESLCSMYVEEEIFDGDNLYRCGACDKLVPAAKSAKLGKLPPFLTLSLLRFNFDFTKCERYKETSRYTFPTRLNIRPFCEQNHLEDSVQMYELFSVIIHKGGCYGGHYHVYIRDVDELGQWSCQEEKKRAAGDAADEQDCPAVILATIIAETGFDKMVPMDQLSQKLQEHTGSSWNKAYRKQHGALRKFLQKHASIFHLSSDGSLVGLAHSVNGTDPQCCEPNNTGKVTPSPKSSSHWFDFNDSTVQCIQEKDIEKQFQGKESAYMLFYRKSQLKRPQEAKGSAQYGVPEYLLHQMNQATQELQQKRLESDRKLYCINLRLHLSSRYHLDNGALHPVTSLGDSTLEISVDRRGNVGDLRQTIFQLLDPSVEGHVLSIAKLLPAGLHVFQDLCDDQQKLESVGVQDGCDLFVWDGKQVGGLCVQSGPDCAPLLLTIMRPCKTKSNGCSQKYSEIQKVFPSNYQLRDLQQTLAGSPSEESLLCSPSTETSEGWSVFAMEDMGKTLKMLGLRDGSSLLLLDSHEEGEVLLAAGKEGPVDLSLYYIQVQDWYSSGSEKRIVQITADPDSTMLSICRKAADLWELPEECGDICLRPVHKSGKLFPPVPEHITLQVAGIKAGSVLGLCRGRAPNVSEVFLSFILGTDLQEGQEQEIILDETLTVKECLDLMLQKAGLPGDAGWHLRKMDWCYEAGDAVTEEDSSLKDLNIRSGDIFVITEGRLPPKNFLKLPVWLYCPKIQQSSVNHVTSHATALQINPSGDHSLQEDVEPDLCFVCHIEISKDASLQDLKLQIMTLAVFDALGIPSPEYLRIWTLDNKRLGKLLRLNHLQISDYKLGINTTLCVEPLQVEEILGPQDMLLRIQLSVPGECRYFPSVDIAWNTSRGCSASALRQKIANHCSLPVDKIEIAKYFPEKHEWLLISSWTQQVSKKKKKKKADNLQGAPYYIKDGDIVGVKNLLLDDRMDFSSEADFIAKEKQRLQIAEGKTKSSPALCNEKSRPSVRKTEASLSIRVGVFR